MCRSTKKTGAFRSGRPLQVARVSSVWEEGEDELGVINDDTGDIAFGFSTAEEPIVGELRRIELPAIPGPAQNWQSCSIGGLSQTERRVGVLRGKVGARNCTFVVVGCPHPRCIHDLFPSSEWSGRVTVGDSVHDAHEGHCVEVAVHDAERDLSLVSARAARFGEVVVDEDSLQLEAQRSLGVERLDRIDAAIVQDDDAADDGHYGLRRGVENWLMDWQPPEWELPSCTWDHLVRNTKDRMPLRCMPKILRQYVCKYKLQHGEFATLGTCWERQDQEEGATLHGAVLSVARRGADDDVVYSDRPLLGVAFATDGVHYYRPCDEEARLRSFAHCQERTRLVSSHLSAAQSRQLITAFYIACVERHADPTIRMAARLVLFHYIVHVGYTARWLGQYRKTAMHVGNGARLRRFSKLTQYEPARLPTSLLNSWLTSDGTVQPNGMASVSRRGSRSKFAGENRYRPKRRKRRTREEESRMLVPK